ncbi:glycosyltransferase family 4 protein [Kineosporiaceae bacterium B12]|nr:glycosyltransferase family 4 protein [Kineococcus rubinsiae]
MTDSYLPRLGGIELHVRDLAGRLAAQGHHVRVVTATGGPGTAAADPFVVHRLQPAGAPGPVDPALWRGADRAGLTRAVADADVVHVHSSVVSPLAWAAARAAHLAGVPAVVTVHSMVPLGTGVALAAALHPRWVGEVRWTAVSEAVAAPLRRLTGRPVAVLHNGVDPVPWRGGPPAAGSSGAFTVVSAGRFTARKRVIPLVRVLRSVRARVPADVPLRAVLVGDGPQHAAVAAAVTRLGMADWVELPGRTTRDGLARCFAAADAYVAPAVWESFGLAALEARCAGLPVAGRAGSGLAEFVADGVEGRLARDDRDLARVLAGWAVDRAEVGRLARHNAATLPSVTWDRVLPATLAAYRAAGAGAGVPGARRTRRELPVLAS